MKRLSEKEWKAFPINTEFRMKKQGNVPTGALVSNSVLKDGMYPRIRVTSRNNGINGFTNICDDKNYRAYSNFVSMSFLGNAFYHPYTASLDMKVHCLQYKNIELNPAMGLFTVTMAERIASGTNYGNQLSSNDLAAKQILLPVDDRGNPDYTYMTLYSTEVRRGMLVRYKNFIAGQLSQLEHKDIPALDEKEWKQFGFAEVFDIKKGFYNKKPEADGTGTIPFLGATDSNNGVTRFLTLEEIEHGTKTGDLHNSPLEKKLFPGRAIAVTNNGSVGHAFYQATEFTCSHDINPLYLRDHEMSREEACFLIKAIEQQGILFQYARKWRPIRMVKSKIMLPVDDKGNPDYEYMEQYAKNMILRKYEQYLAFINRQAVTGEV